MITMLKPSAPPTPRPFSGQWQPLKSWEGGMPGEGMEDPHPVPLPPSFALDIAFLILFLRCILYNKQQNASKAFSWIQWIVQVNTETWGVGCGIPQVYRHLVRIPGTCYWHLKWRQFVQMSPWPVGSVLTPDSVRIELIHWIPSWCWRIRELMLEKTAWLWCQGEKPLAQTANYSQGARAA